MPSPDTRPADSSSLKPPEAQLSLTRRKNRGIFFTPLDQAEAMVKHYEIHRKWAEGASVLDPAAGTGFLLEALIRIALQERIHLTGEMLGNLSGFETEPGFAEAFEKRIQEKYGLQFTIPPIRTADFLQTGHKNQTDILLGNPPWLNYTDPSRRRKKRTQTPLPEVRAGRNPGRAVTGKFQNRSGSPLYYESFDGASEKRRRGLLFYPPFPGFE